MTDQAYQCNKNIDGFGARDCHFQIIDGGDEGLKCDTCRVSWDVCNNLCFLIVVLLGTFC